MVLARRGARRSQGARRLLAAAVAVAAVAAAAAARSTLPEPYGALYHATDAILAEFHALAQRHPELLTWTPAAEGGGAANLTLGLATFAAPARAGAPPPAQRPHILLVFGEHAREVITSDTALWLARALAGETEEIDTWPEAAAAQESTRVVAAAGAVAPDRAALPLRAWARALLDHVTISIVPVEVPSARKAVEGGELCRRKSLAEVDLNRNWGTAWRDGSARGADEYGGAAPFSEPQSAALRALAEALRPRAYANVHSGEWAIYVPWDHKKALALGLPPDTDALVETLNTHCKCTRGAGGSASNYLAFGTSMDWMWEELGVPYSLTFELYGSNSEGRRPDSWRLPETPVEEFTAAGAAGRRLAATQQGLSCLAMFNPATETAYRTVVAGWVHNFLLLGEHIATHTPLQPPSEAVTTSAEVADAGATPALTQPDAVADAATAAASLPRKALRPGAGADALIDARRDVTAAASAMTRPMGGLVILMAAILFVLRRNGGVLPWRTRAVGGAIRPRDL